MCHGAPQYEWTCEERLEARLGTIHLERRASLLTAFGDGSVPGCPAWGSEVCAVRNSHACAAIRAAIRRRFLRSVLTDRKSAPRGAQNRRRLATRLATHAWLFSGTGCAAIRAAIGRRLFSGTGCAAMLEAGGAGSALGDLGVRLAAAVATVSEQLVKV
jgi:hypothetical protein